MSTDAAIFLYRCSLFKLLVLVLMLQKRQRGGIITPQEASSASLVHLMQQLGLSTSSSGHHYVFTTGSVVVFFGVFTLTTMQMLLVCAATCALFLPQFFTAFWNTSLLSSTIFMSFTIILTLAKSRSSITMEITESPHACRECCRQGGISVAWSRDSALDGNGGW